MRLLETLAFFVCNCVYCVFLVRWLQQRGVRIVAESGAEADVPGAVVMTGERCRSVCCLCALVVA